MAKARCEWNELKFDPSTQNLHKRSSKNNAREAFGSEAQQFIDKANYPKMPNHVKKILNRANHLEDKPYNDRIVLHLAREMRLNDPRAPDEVTLVPPNKTEPAETKTETKPVKNTSSRKQTNSQR